MPTAGVWGATLGARQVIARILVLTGLSLFTPPILRLVSLFFVVWHLPVDLSWPGLGFVMIGVYKALTLGFLRAHSRSLYPCILVHCLKLAF